MNGVEIPVSAWLLAVWLWGAPAPVVVTFPDYQACAGLRAAWVDSPAVRAVSACTSVYWQDKGSAQ